MSVVTRRPVIPYVSARRQRFEQNYRAETKRVGWKSHPRGAEIPLSPVDRKTKHVYSLSREDIPVRYGLHGTSMKALGHQLNNREFENRGRRLYFADEETAGRYAHSKARVDGSKPVIVEISSRAKPMMNDWMNENLGMYEYIPEGEQVFIERAWEVKEEQPYPEGNYSEEKHKEWSKIANASIPRICANAFKAAWDKM